MERKWLDLLSPEQTYPARTDTFYLLIFRFCRPATARLQGRFTGHHRITLQSTEPATAAGVPRSAINAVAVRPASFKPYHGVINRGRGLISDHWRMDQAACPLCNMLATFTGGCRALWADRPKTGVARCSLISCTPADRQAGRQEGSSSSADQAS